MSREFLRMFERIIAPAPDHISIVSREYVYLVVNEAYLRCHGKRREDIVGRKVPDLLGAQVFEQVVKGNLDRCFAGETVNYRAWFDFAAGRRCMDIIYYPYMPDGLIEGAVVVSRDITEYRIAEERLGESEEKYRHLFESLNDAALLADCETGLVIETNIQGQKLLGMTRDEIIGMHQSKLHPPCKAEEYRDKFASHIARGKAADYEGEIVRKDGTIVPVYISAAPVTLGSRSLILGLFRDITERKQAESALIESKRFSDRLIDSMQDGFAVFDSNRRFLDGNPAFFKMVGFSKDELAGLQPPYPYWPEEQAGEIEGAFRDLEKGIRKDYEFTFMKRDGTLFPVILSPSQLTGRYGSIKNYFVVVKDITLRKKLELELLKAQKLDSLGKLSGGLAHEFNNLLTVILSNVSLAVFYNPGELPKKRLEIAEAACLKAKELMKQFLTFARGNTPVKRTLDIASLLASWPDSVQAGPGVRYHMDIEKGLMPVEGDEEMLSQAIRNVLSNAAESMPGGGTVRISARNVQSENNGVNVPHIEIVVEDAGGGIKKADMGRIFDPYFTTKEGSSGLGLSVAYSVVDFHGGTIDVDSSPRGTSVSIRLPACIGPVNAARELQRFR